MIPASCNTLSTTAEKEPHNIKNYNKIRVRVWDTDIFLKHHCGETAPQTIAHTSKLGQNKKRSMFPVVCPKTAMPDAFFNILSIEKQQCAIFYEKKEYTQKQYHTQVANHFWYLFHKKVRNSLKYLIYHINIIDVFNMFGTKNYFGFYFL